MTADSSRPSADGDKPFELPKIDYKPCRPPVSTPPIGLIGAGSITSSHLGAYRSLGLNVVAIADVKEENAKSKRDEFFPEAAVYTDHKELLARDDIEVVDVATHVNVRPRIVRDALESGRHVLSQKPFVLDLDEGRALIDFARKKGLKLAVNQNVRWAPHYSYLRNAIGAGVIGNVNAIHVLCHWNHCWIIGTPFEKMRHVVLYDYVIHWFDLCTCFMGGERPKRVFAAASTFDGQRFSPPSIASVIIEYENAQATMQFHAHVAHGKEDSTIINGTKGTLRSRGSNINDQPHIDLFLENGTGQQKLEGQWVETGFQSTMTELLWAIEENREPSNSAASTLTALETTFAAMKSADTGLPVVPGEVQVLESY